MSEVVSNEWRNILKTGKGGAKITWKLYDGGTLEFEGTGAMYNLGSERESSWYESVNEIEKVVIGEGITTIGSNSFCRHKNLCEVILPNSLKRIGECSFYECKNIAEITIGENVENIGICTFYKWESTQLIIIKSKFITKKDVPSYENNAQIIEV